jgi:hypothetical protein
MLSTRPLFAFHRQGLTSSHHLNRYWFVLHLVFTRILAAVCSPSSPWLVPTPNPTQCSYKMRAEPSGGLLPAQGEGEDIATTFNARVPASPAPSITSLLLAPCPLLCIWLNECVSALTSHLCALSGPLLPSLPSEVTASAVTLRALRTYSFLEIPAHRKVWAQPTEI